MTAQELKSKRLAAGLTMQELAEQTGLKGAGARQRIYDYESTRRGITPAMATLFDMIFSRSSTSS